MLSEFRHVACLNRCVRGDRCPQVADVVEVVKVVVNDINGFHAGGRQSVRSVRQQHPGFDRFEDEWVKRAPLKWDLGDQEPAAKACLALLSDWFPATTGEIVHVDGGYHAIGA